jgi:hypothetical protein
VTGGVTVMGDWNRVSRAARRTGAAMLAAEKLLELGGIEIVPVS